MQLQRAEESELHIGVYGSNRRELLQLLSSCLLVEERTGESACMLTGWGLTWRGGRWRELPFARSHTPPPPPPAAAPAAPACIQSPRSIHSTSKCMHAFTSTLCTRGLGFRVCQRAQGQRLQRDGISKGGWARARKRHTTFWPFRSLAAAISGTRRTSAAGPSAQTFRV